MWFAVTKFHYYWFQWRVLVSNLNAVSGAFPHCQKTYVRETLKCCYALIVLANCRKVEMALDLGIIAGIQA